VTVKAPPLEPRREKELAAELRERARAWIPSWGLEDGERDFGRALLQVAARFGSEVAERLDRAGEKMQRGFLDWLAVRGEAARPARMPVVFKLADAAKTAVQAPPPVSMQVEANGTSVVFETETDVHLIPGRLEAVVGVDADNDAFYLPPPGLSSLEPIEPLPTEWQLKSFAAAGAKKLQLDPEAGLIPGIVIEASGQQYRIEAVEKEIVTIDPPLTAGLDTGTVASKVTAFTPFDGKTRDRQEHALYLGHKELLDVTAPATIGVAGAQALPTNNVAWEYWGKVDGKDDVDWQPFTLVDPQPPNAVLLQKKKGALEETEINGKKSRWIRARIKNITSGKKPLELENLRLLINPVRCDEEKIPCDEIKGEPPAAEGMANTTPLVLESAFLPLGREPRQFDAFYLASAEAFSKPGAKVQLCFQMADPSFESLAVLRSGPVTVANKILAGVAQDGHLHLLSFDAATGTLSHESDPHRPPSPGVGGVAVAGPPIPLDARPDYRAAMWMSGALFSLYWNVAVAAGGTVWAWQHPLIVIFTGGWKNYGEVGPVNDTNKKISGLVHLESGVDGYLYALREQKLFVRDLSNPNAVWKKVSLNLPIDLETIVPIQVQDAGALGPGSLLFGMVGVDKDKKLYTVKFGADPAVATCVKLLDDVASDVAPAAVHDKSANVLRVVVPDKDFQKLLGYRSSGSTKDTKIDGATIKPVGHSVDVILSGGQLSFALTMRIDSQTTALAFWTPFAIAGLHPPLFITAIPSAGGAAGGAPTQLPAHVLVPSDSSKVLVASLDPNGRKTFHTKLWSALIADAPTEQLASNDKVAIPFDDNGNTAWKLQDAPAPTTRGIESLYAFDVDSLDDKVFVYRASVAARLATVVDPLDLTKITVDLTGPAVTQDMILLITTDKPIDPTALYTITSINSVTGDAVLGRDLDVNDPNNPPANVSYKVPEDSQADLLPLLHLNPATNGKWQASLLSRIPLIFPGADPERQSATAWDVDGNGNPLLVVLAQHWAANGHPPDSGFGTEFIVDGSAGEFVGQLGDTSSNPALSWEYGNGNSWWALAAVQDETLNLKRSGAVRFTIPDDLRPMDWAGRTNYWIRARLVGGDYGTGVVTITTTQNGTTSTQKITRDTGSAPTVLNLRISYRLCKGTLPKLVLTRDSGSFRDQSDANRTRGAIVEAFVSLAIAIGRLSSPVAAPVPATGRMIFIGLTASPSGTPVNVLLLVEKEHIEHEQFAPLKTDALIANRFEPIVADDVTRAVGESGLLKMTFAREPALRELFGIDNLAWLRLTPRGSGPVSQWQPSIRGAYLNAVWASAQETLTRELVGSSEGAPNLTLFLARPPLLEGTLELRVKEPLGEEERQQLREGDENRLRSDVVGLPGDWVLWDEVTDPLDEPATARVYALDESNGEIRFGDGQHGRIPPIGRDSIVAFRYRRTEAIPANGIPARAPLDLVSPIPTVEAVFAADPSAGGAPPETDERVLRFGTSRLRHRNRAVTAQDFEDLALESSPDIEQARCFVRPGSVRLVVVLRGDQPVPSAAQVRELRRHLLASAPASLSAAGALRITGPRILRLRVVLQLLVASLDDAGGVAHDVEEKLRARFDEWPLGASPVESDIALTVIDTRHLESLGNVEFLEISPDGKESPWTGAVARDQLVMLDKDAVRLEFKTVEVLA
jgi:hypothetical protein